MLARNCDLARVAASASSLACGKIPRALVDQRLQARASGAPAVARAMRNISEPRAAAPRRADALEPRRLDRSAAAARSCMRRAISFHSAVVVARDDVEHVLARRQAACSRRCGARPRRPSRSRSLPAGSGSARAPAPACSAPCTGIPSSCCPAAHAARRRDRASLPSATTLSITHGRRAAVGRMRAGSTRTMPRMLGSHSGTVRSHGNRREVLPPLNSLVRSPSASR